MTGVGYHQLHLQYRAKLRRICAPVGLDYRTPVAQLIALSSRQSPDELIRLDDQRVALVTCDMMTVRRMLGGRSASPVQIDDSSGCTLLVFEQHAIVRLRDSQGMARHGLTDQSVVRAISECGVVEDIEIRLQRGPYLVQRCWWDWAPAQTAQPHATQVRAFVVECERHGNARVRRLTVVRCFLQGAYDRAIDRVDHGEAPALNFGGFH